MIESGPTSQQRRVALAVPQGLPFLERVLHGIAEFARANRSWIITRRPEGLDPSIEWLRQWSGDGAIALITRDIDVEIARTLPFNVVNLASHLEDTRLPTVAVDNFEIGVIAAQHLIENRFKRFGYYGASNFHYSRQRFEGFRQTIEAAGGTYHALDVYTAAEPNDRQDAHKQLEIWLGSLRTPVGIMASTDIRAAMVLQACRAIGLRVPSDVAVLGVDNDPVFAEFDDPPLTTIARNDRQVGQQAAALLNRLMAGEPAPDAPILIPPQGVIMRRSTQTAAIDDPIVAAAVDYIHQHVGERFGVESLVAHTSVSRRSLETRFRLSVGTSPYDYINAVRIERAKKLLTMGEKQKLSAVAGACGFHDARRMNVVFERLAGVKPSAFRANFLRKQTN